MVNHESYSLTSLMEEFTGGAKKSFVDHRTNFVFYLLKGGEGKDYKRNISLESPDTRRYLHTKMINVHVYYDEEGKRSKTFTDHRLVPCSNKGFETDFE